MTISSITSEQNCNRKTHRLNIPIQAIIDNHSYTVEDWSTHGLKIKLSSSDFPIKLEVDDSTDISLVLPTGESSIVLQVKVIIRSIYEGKYGIEILEISDKNKRVLRHYATLAMDGNRNHIDELSSSLFMTNVPTPITEPIQLSDKEYKNIHNKFLKRFFFYIGVGTLFTGVIVLILFYNFIIISRSNGLISGNSKNYTASRDGSIKSIYVNNSQRVLASQVLFEIDTKEEKELLKALQEQQVFLNNQIKTTEFDLNVFIERSRIKELEIKRIDEEELKYLKQSYLVQKQTYERATILYQEQLIPITKYIDIQNQYFSFRENYNSVVLHNNSTDKKKVSTNHELFKNQDYVLVLQKELTTLRQNYQINKLKIISLEQQINKSIIVAEETGTVHNIFHKDGDDIEYLDKIITLETDRKAYLLTKLTSDEITRIHIDEQCLLYSKRTNKSYWGHIVGIGYSMTEGVTTNTTEISQNEIPIRIEFDDPSIRFHLNEYLEVYIINNSTIAKNILNVLPQSFITL
ncbi:MAG: PilZ domain-containing protein [Campylobacterota bacterium]|nr:PilZ domain-containing protein [Campylobacterota bacterium]